MTIYQSSSLKEDVDDISESESSSWAGAGPPSGAGASGFLENNAMKKKESYNSYCKPLSTIQNERERNSTLQSARKSQLAGGRPVGYLHSTAKELKMGQP